MIDKDTSTHAGDDSSEVMLRDSSDDHWESVLPAWTIVRAWGAEYASSELARGNGWASSSTNAAMLLLADEADVVDEEV